MRKAISLRRIVSGAGLTVAVLAALAACGGGGGGSGGGSSGSSSSGGGNSGGTTPVTGPAWSGYARDAQHSDLAPTLAQGGVTAQNLGQIAWEVPIDTNVDNTVPIHYGSPMITTNNTVLVAVKTQTDGGFQMQAHTAAKGALVWSANSDYVLPPHGWIPSFGSTLTPGNRLYMPGAGGKVYYTDSPDSAGGSSMKTAVFYGASAYSGASATYDSTVYINTPITSDSSGNIYFGFVVTGSNPAGLTSGFARIGADGSATWAPAPTINSPTGIVGQIVTAPSLNAAPGISNDGKTVYVSVHGPLVTNYSDVGFLLAIDSTTLATKNSVRLMDPVTNSPAWVSDNATASPVIGPDGDVYYGVLESNFPNHNARGWLLHFDATLATSKTPGSFGWDDTPSIVPASLVAAYHGTSSYLLMSKYNNYAGAGTGDGKNKMAILDPNALETDPIAGNAVMNEVLTVLGPTADTTASFAGAVREWCVNSAAVDPNGKAIFINSEDGKLYRWDLTVGTLTQSIWLDNGYGQAYTPTAIGPDGTVYSINNGTLIAVTQ
jgi:hypothetical protein